MPAADEAAEEGVVASERGPSVPLQLAIASERAFTVSGDWGATVAPSPPHWTIATGSSGGPFSATTGKRRASSSSASRLVAVS